MSQFEYITVFLSIVVALAVAELLAGVGRVIRERDHVEIYWVHIAWMLLAVLATTNSWWQIWSIRAYVFTSYFEFLALMVPSLMFVMIAFLLSPPIEPNRAFDLRAYYFRQIRWVAPLFAFQLSTIALSRLALGAEELATTINAIRVVVVALFLGLGFSKGERFHSAAVFLVGTLFFVAIAVYSIAGI